METKTPLKRTRGEEEEQGTALKRQKSYGCILSILEEDEDESDQDLSSLITTLQQELSSSSSSSSSRSSSCFASSESTASASPSPSSREKPCPHHHFNHIQLPSSCPDDQIDPSIIEISSYFPSSNASTAPEGEEEEGERVMRHLLEASDDELGIPTAEEDGGRVVIDDEGGGQRFDVEDISGGDLLMPIGGCGGGEGLWEIEDEAANYYTLLQSELFM